MGIVTAQVGAVGTVRTFTRKNGQEGRMRRVTLQDRSGEADLVLWGDEVLLASEGPLQAGAHVVLRGPTVKPGFREGVELHLGGAAVESVHAPEERLTIEGVLESIDDSKITGTPPDVRFHAEARLVTSEGLVNVVVWDDCIKSMRAVLPGATLRIVGATLHPALEGWFVADGATIEQR